MQLTPENIDDWKAELDSLCKKKHGISQFSKTQTNDYWLQNYLGKDEGQAMDKEME